MKVFARTGEQGQSIREGAQIEHALKLQTGRRFTETMARPMAKTELAQSQRAPTDQTQSENECVQEKTDQDSRKIRLQ